MDDNNLIQPRMRNATTSRRLVDLLVTSIASVLLAGCATGGYRHPAAPAPSMTPLYFYPTRGQDSAQQDRDRYECYVWAVDQSGFDPSAPAQASYRSARVGPERKSGAGLARGALAGAAIGAIASDDAGEGAVIGALAGAIVGAAADAVRSTSEDRVRDSALQSRYEVQARNYQRAITACLEGRGYTVQ